MQRFKSILYNTSFAFNCLLVFLLLFENRLYLPPWVQTVGRMHPLLLHFPIVLLVLCIFWELFAGFKTSPANQHETGDGLLLITSLTAVTSALMGLLLSREAGYAPDVLAWHKWGGVAISLLSFAWYTFRQTARRIKAAGMLTGAVAMFLIIVTGHLGANITHGENFLSAPVSKDKQVPAVLFEDAIIYANMVQPIFKTKCISCHNDKKAKGELVMETFAQLLKGGKGGALWDSAQKDFGLLLHRVHLPADDKKHMPPIGRPQLTDEEVAIIYHWIRSGASSTAKVIQLPATDTLRSIGAAIFNTIETDDYTFKPADESKIKALRNNYRFVTPLALGSPALGVEFFGAAQFNATQVKELLPVKEQVVSINLNKMPVTDEDLTTIAQFINLRRLNLSFTNIKGGGLTVLNSLKELKQLSLSGTGVTAENLQTLSALPKLTELFIWSTPARSQPLAALQKKIKNTRIETGFTGDTIIIKLNAPIVENEEQVVLQPVALKLKHYVKGVTIRYTTDGTEPDSSASPIYKNDFMVDKNITVKTKAFKTGWLSSDVAERTFYKAGYRIDSVVLLQQPPDLPYKKMSAAILKDSQKGDQNFGSGKWIGYRGIPMEALLYFDTIKTIASVTIGSLIDINGYIMPPQQVEVWAGSKPSQLHLVKKIKPAQPQKSEPGYMKGYELTFNPVKEKYLKVVVVPVKKLPEWHRGKGDKAWAFVDEIFLN
jgi:uncharacterized membrane protein/mono/diheme cytochrome c family protein